MVDDEFEKIEGDNDVVVEDALTGFKERKSECVKQKSGWVHQDRVDDNPKTEAYRQLNKE